VKVVQRITVRIEFDSLENVPALRPGMSTRVDIDTGKNRLQRLGSDKSGSEKSGDGK
jgi:multidrug resistance efflux pump